GGRLHETVDTGPVSLVADDLMVRIGDAVLLDDVSFALPSSTLLAVIGPSGCGKSTLVRAMTGLRPASQGRVRYDGRDLYAEYAELRYRIGVDAQDDVLHRQLTLRRALRFCSAPPDPVSTNSGRHPPPAARVLGLGMGSTTPYGAPASGGRSFLATNASTMSSPKSTQNREHGLRRYRGSDLYRKYVLDVMDEAE